MTLNVFGDNTTAIQLYDSGYAVTAQQMKRELRRLSDRSSDPRTTPRRGHPVLAPVALAGAAHAHGDRDRAERLAQMYDAGMSVPFVLAQRPVATRPGSAGSRAASCTRRRTS